MKIIRNRTVLGILCILISLIICFGIVPLVNRGLSSKTKIVRIKSDAKAGTQITSSIVEEVEVGKYNLPENIIKNLKEVEGKYLSCDVCAGDYLLSNKVSDTPAKENEYLYGLNGEKQAMSITINKFAEGLSGKLMSGDIVSVIVSDFNKTGQTIIPTELKYVEVIAVTAKSGNDANTESTASTQTKKEDEDEEKELPTTVTVLVTPMQSKILAMLEAESEMHLSLVYRGDDKTRQKFIDAQDEVLKEIEELLKEAEETELEQSGQNGQGSTEYKEIGAASTTVVSGYASIRQGSIITNGNKIATSKLPATADLGTEEIKEARKIVKEE